MHNGNRQTWQQTGGSCSLQVYEQTVPPPHVIFCPDWIKVAGIPENVFSLLLHEPGEEGHRLQTKHKEYSL